MAKRSRTKSNPDAHKRKRKEQVPFVLRPFEGLPGECDVIALRELVPAATTTLKLADDLPVETDLTEVRLCSLLPMAAPAMKRDTGEVWLGLQVQHSFGDPARDLGAVLLDALTAPAGVVGLTSAPEPGPRLQDLVAPGQELDIAVHEGFDFWVDDVEDKEPLEMALEQANDAAHPTVKIPGLEAAYWTDVKTKEHLRWVMPHPERKLLDALARLHASGDDVLVPGARLVGMFRAYGLLAPVWDLEVGTGAEAVTEPAVAFGAKLDEALADDSPLTSEQRSARNGLASRQVTIR